MRGYLTLRHRDGKGSPKGEACRQAREALTHLGEHSWGFAALGGFRAPAATASHWPKLCNLLSGQRRRRNSMGGADDPGSPLVSAAPRAALRQSRGAHCRSRSAGADRWDLCHPKQLSDRANPGPPEATSAEAIPPHLDEDYLVLSTIHSAKGQEWEAVFLLKVIARCIPLAWQSAAASRSTRSAASLSGR
jgi:ATP-dependent DNA helicase UvrD/PcrA